MQRKVDYTRQAIVKQAVKRKHEDYHQLGSMDQDGRLYEAKQRQSSHSEVNQIKQAGNDFTQTNCK